MNYTETINSGKTDLIPCFLCGNGLEIRASKRNKPYFTCDDCGIQTFIRGKRGIKAFDEYKTLLRTGGIITTDKNNLQIMGLINRLTELRGKLRQVESQEGILNSFLSVERKDISIRVLYSVIRQVEDQLTEFLQKNNYTNQSSIK